MTRDVPPEALALRLSSPDIDEEDIRAVTEVLRSGRLALGPRTRALEQAFAEFCGASHAVALSSGTAALHVAVRALELGAGDEVLVPSFTFAASVSVIVQEGATPIFVDIDPATRNLDPDDCRRKIGPRTRGLVGVDLFGHPAEWTALLELARRHDLRVIDDACEAVGAEYRGQRLGSLGDAATFAFYPNKQMTTGEGGMLVTNHEPLAALARSLRNHGRSETGARLRHERPGFNYRMDEMSAALGLSQLRRLESFLDQRARVAEGYRRRLEGVARVRPPVVRPHVRMSWFVYVVTLDEGLERDPVMAGMEERGVPVRGYFPPVHLEPWARTRLGTAEGLLPVTESIARRTIALPFHNRLTENEIDRVVTTLERCLQGR